MFQSGGAFTSPRGKQGGGSKLMISNLDYGVSDADLKVSYFKLYCIAEFWLFGPKRHVK